MRLTRWIPMAVIVAVGGISAIPARATTAYSVRHDTDSGDHSLYSIDLETGVTTLVGPITANLSGGGGVTYDRVAAIDFIGGDLYGVDYDKDQLIRINPATGQAFPIGGTNGVDGLGFDLAEDAATMNGEAVGLSFDPGNLLGGPLGSLYLTDFKGVDPAPFTFYEGTRYVLSLTTGAPVSEAALTNEFDDPVFEEYEVPTALVDRPGNTLFGFTSAFGAGQVWQFNNTEEGVAESLLVFGFYTTSSVFGGSNLGLDYEETPDLIWGILSEGGEIFSIFDIDGLDEDISDDVATADKTGFSSLGVYQPEAVAWQVAGGGDWDSDTNWDNPHAPGFAHTVTLAPTSAAVITGPAGVAMMQSLEIGSGNGHLADLQLQSTGTIYTLNGLTIKDDGRVSGGGTITGGPLQIDAGGELSVSGGGTLEADTDSVSNAGMITVNAATATFESLVTNQAGTGQINATGGTLNFNGGLLNQNTMSLNGTTVNGEVNSPSGSSIDIAGTSSFNDDYSGAGAFTGNGTAGFNAGFDPGDSVATVSIAGSLALGNSAMTKIELEGHAPGTGHDQVIVDGNVSFDGTLLVTVSSALESDLVPLDPFIVMTFASNPGESKFDAIDFTPPSAVPGLFFKAQYNTGDLTLLAAAADGDVNLDAAVDLDDLVVLAANFLQAVGTRAWGDGDFNGDGFVNAADLNLMAVNFGVSPTTDPLGWTAEELAAQVGITIVQTPEPASAVLFGIAALLLARRRQPHSD